MTFPKGFVWLVFRFLFNFRFQLWRSLFQLASLLSYNKEAEMHSKYPAKSPFYEAIVEVRETMKKQYAQRIAKNIYLNV